MSRCGTRSLAWRGVGDVVDSEAAVEARSQDLIELTGLVRYRDAFSAELSTGTRRIVEIACAFAQDPAVLLVDEPSSGIAQRETEALGELLLDLRARTGMSLIVIEHDIPLISAIADRLVCLHLGEVIAEGAPRDVVSAPAVVASSLGTEQAAISRSGRPRQARRKASPAGAATGRRGGPRSTTASG